MRKKERKKKEEEYRFLTLRVKTEWTYIYMLASIIKKASRFYPTNPRYLLTFFFSLTPPVFFFSIFFGIGYMHVCIPYLVKSKCLVSEWLRKEFIRKLSTDDVEWN